MPAKWPKFTKPSPTPEKIAQTTAMKDPTVAIVTTAKGTFFKPLYESLAEAQPTPWKTALIWPDSLKSDHPEDTVRPQARNLDVVLVRSGRWGGTPPTSAPVTGYARKQTFLPSRALWQCLSQRNIRALLIHEFSPYTLLGLMFAKLRGIPVVVSTEIGRKNAHFFSLRVRAWHTFWGRFANGIAACSPAALEPLSSKTLPVIATYHAVDSRVYVPVIRKTDPAAPVVFSYLGQLIPRKGIDIFIRAAARLRSSGNANFKIRLIGGGDVEWARRLAVEAGLQDCVGYTGFLSAAAIRTELGTSDVFVLPTRQDTYAAVVHEAACLGLPLLISNRAGAADALVKHGLNGFIFDPENPDELTGRMRELMEPALRHEMGIQSRAIAETFSAHERGRALWDWMHSQFSL